MPIRTSRLITKPAFDIVSTYFPLLQQQGRSNQYNIIEPHYAQERTRRAYDRLAPFQADQARQEELAARTVTSAVERYQQPGSVQDCTLGPANQLENALKNGKPRLAVPLTESEGFQTLDRRLDVERNHIFRRQ